jgi:acyl-ACP thioesterase|uniref:acyl-ACP thioesterase domain-containing protein n=1 Tax=Candidatus Limivicinus sp. TaxID=3030905 RepID=UPI003FEEFF1E
MDAYTRIFTLERADEAELFHCMQEAAGEDADRRGGGMDALFAKGLAWVLLWQRLDIVRRPAAGEQLRIVTMPGKGRLGLYPRRFELWSGDERIGAARSVWAIINAETRSMAALSDAPLSGETERQSLRMDSIPAPDGGESFRFAPAAEYIDRNGHMNNAAYLAALAEYLPENSGFGLSILYHREIMPGDEVTVHWQDTDGARLFQGTVGDEECFRLSYSAAVSPA